MRTTTSLVVTVLIALLGVLGPAGAAVSGAPIAVPPDLAATDVSFTGFGGVVLHGTVVAATTSSAPRPGVVLVTGSGAGVPREHLLTEAVAFARQGLAVLIYDKRTAGYSRFRRSYSELADDVLAGVRLLRARPGVDPAAVGVWGLSEGGWVAPLAASRSRDVAFVIVVGGNAMPPVRQQLWNETSALSEAGVRGSLIDRGKLELIRWGADAGLFAEAYYDAPGALGRVRQPLLGIWGAGDRQTPPGDNPPLFAQALERGGNRHYTLRSFAGADHAAHESPDGGITRGPALAAGYAELVGGWVRDMTSGRLPDADVTTPPRQERGSVEVARSAGWESAEVQVAALGLLVVAFGTYPLVGLARRVRQVLRRTERERERRGPVSRWAGVLAGAGSVSALGPVVYLFCLMAAGQRPDPGPVVAGRPLPWLALQGLAVCSVVAAVLTVRAWRRRPVGSVSRVEAGRLGLLLMGAVVLVPWAVYWGLLVP